MVGSNPSEEHIFFLVGRYLYKGALEKSKNWGQFHESKVKSNIPPGRIPLNFDGLFSKFFGSIYVYSEVLRKQLF